ncbi:MAG: type VI secretion system tip protein TssI/VgrG [Myxococcota bacterium]
MSDPSLPGLPGGLMARVRYGFSTTDGPDVDWHVRRMQLTEQLSVPYTLDLELTTTELDVDAEALLGASCELTIEREPLLRSLYGVVSQLDWLGVAADRLHVRVVMVPALWLCSLTEDSRVFQELSVPQILQAVLEPRLADHGRSLRLELRGTYEPRDYCVQYRESDLAFASRLMEEEGIAFTFDHSGDEGHEVLVLCDDNGVYPDVSTLDGLTEIPIITDRPDNADLESIQSFELRRRVHATSVARLDYDLQQPFDPIHYEATAQDERGHTREIYQHMGRRFVLDDGEALATREQQRHHLGGRVGRGRSNVTGLHPGGIFEMFDHGHDGFNGKYIAIRVLHRGEQPEALGASAQGPQYENSFECVPRDMAYRPPRRIRSPRVDGPQTATVTGPAGEEIHTDALGRIKVFMHWDRLGSRNDTSSCWVRVAQTWAGTGWGSSFIPRVGMEVLVEFLEGNPDRPLVTGCVYNGRNPTPYVLPDDKTKSTIKSSSSPGGDGYNELRFEDAADSEEIWMHAQKDFNTKVRHDHNTNVGLHQTLQVGGNQTVTIDGNQTITVKGDPAADEYGGGNPGGDFKGSSTDVTGDYSVKASKTAYLSAPTSITLECPGSSIVLEPGKITLTAGGKAAIVLDGNALMRSSVGSSVFLDGNACMEAKSGGSVLLDGNACMASKAGSQVLLDGNACMASKAGSQVLLDGNALVSANAGASALYDASAKISGATATLAGDSTATVSASTVNVTGGGEVSVSGGVVKLN